MMKTTVKDLLEAGVHFGHRVNKWNPKMASYIFGQREGIHILDLEKTLEDLKKACDYLKEVSKSGGNIIFLCTKRQAQEIVKQEAKRCGAMFLTERWIGGLLTNFDSIKKTINKLPELEEKSKVMEEQGYTKRERLLVDREIEKLDKVFGGTRGLDKLPVALFIVDSHKEDIAVREAKKTHVKVVSITDTNGDPTQVDYSIPANDDAIKSISLLVKCVADAIEEGRSVGEKKEAEKETKEEVKKEEKVETKAKKKEEKELVTVEAEAPKAKAKVKTTKAKVKK